MKTNKHSQVCYVCGDIGYYELLVSCSNCDDSAIHRYCLGIIPGSKDDTFVVEWVCEFCNSPMETNPHEIVLVDDQPEPLQIVLPKSYSRTLEEKETSNQCDKSSVSSTFNKPPEAISSEFVLVVSSSGEITIHEGRDFCLLGLASRPYETNLDTSVMQLDPFVIEPDCAHSLDGAHKDEESEQGCSIEDTVELDFGTDEENDVCNSTIHEIKRHNDICLVDSSDENMEDQVHQVIKASEIGGSHQLVFTDNQNEPLTFPVFEAIYQPIISGNESQSSICTYNYQSSTCETVLSNKRIYVSEPSKTDDSPEMSITSSVLDMANELLESRLERIDVQVGPYKINSDLAPILGNILEKYGDIFRDCAIEPDIFLVKVCKAIQYLQQIPFKRIRQQNIDFIRDKLKIPEAVGIDLEWLKKHCDYLEKIVHQTARYHALKKERNHTIKKAQLKQAIMGLKGVNSSKSQDELRILEDELACKDERLKKLESGMKSIKSLWRRISKKSLVDGLF